MKLLASTKLGIPILNSGYLESYVYKQQHWIKSSLKGRGQCPKYTYFHMIIIVFWSIKWITAVVGFDVIIDYYQEVETKKHTIYRSIKLHYFIDIFLKLY
jgi:hypothetical protein